MKHFILLVALVCLAVTSIGCETIRGVGEDLQNTGENIWEATGGK